MSLPDFLSGDTTDREIVTSRLVPYPRPRVWQAWTEAAEIVRWWGPNGFTNTVDRFEPTDGGKFLLTMHGPDGTDYANDWTFLTVTPQSHIRLHHLRDVHEFVLEARFADEAGGTRYVTRMIMPTSAECEALRPMVTGANEQNIDRICAHLGGQPIP